ncbi:MAG: 4-hydroxy-tetrahydrodipicolinate reductase [Deltaproteobacteria bacterium]|nr:4-hydroxy-tetrahydrodipicolinate reductase [Deltaproteobacteria bacterium]MCB9785424.1 4-hydroxy-tetrahydrodipicolinate reductase [Deltaproteobacteria bacterium]
MGRRLAALADAHPELAVTASVDRGTPPIEALDPAGVDCVIDFSVRELVASTAQWCRAHRVPLALGTTGLEPADLSAVDAAAAEVPVVFAPNYSIGVNALFALAGELATMLGAGFDLEVVEAHHRHKVDAPSGTARRLVEVLAEARGSSYEAAARAERNGIIGPRTDAEIGVATVRGGDVVGEHTVYYLGTGEQVSLTHRATDRDIFARGALRAAAWLAAPGRAPGRYAMLDVLRTP